MQKQIDGTKCLIQTAAANPKQLMQRDAGGLRPSGIKRILRVNQSTDFRVRRASRQSRLQQGSHSRGKLAKNFSQAAARQAAGKLIHCGDSGGSRNGLRLLKTERRGDASGKSGLDMKTKSVGSGEHDDKRRGRGLRVYSLFVRHEEFAA